MRNAIPNVALARYQPVGTITPLAMPEPTLPETSAYGGINLNHLTTGDRSVTLQAGPYEAFLPGDRLDVYWDGASSPIASAPVTQRGLYAYVDIPGEAILLAGAGRKEFSFVLTSGVGGGTLPSDPASVLVDIDVPGDPDPGTDPINPKLPAPTVVPLLIDAAQAALGATVTVPPWTGMAVDDVLSVYWGTVPVKVTNPPVGQPVVVTIDSATILAAGDSPTLPVNYDIVDAVGNYSKRSPSTAVNVQAGTTFFIAPKVLEAPTNVLDLDQLAGANVQVQVDPEQEGIALGDTVVLTWKGLTGEGVVVPPLTYSQKVEAVTYMVFPILNADAVALARGSALIYYEVSSAGGGAPRKSRDRQISIIGEGQALAAPLVQEAGGGVLDPAQLIDGAHLQIDPYSAMRLGDTVTYYWTGKLLGSTASMLSGARPVTGNDLNPPKPLIFTVPKAEVEALVGGTIEVYYTVDTYTRALLAPSATLVLSVAGAIALPPPIVDHVVNGVLDPANAVAGTNVRVKTTYPGAAKGDSILVAWNGKDATNSYSNTFGVTPGVDVVLPIPSRYVTGNESATVSATYQVFRTSAPTLYGTPLSFQVEGTQDFTIDPTPVNLVGTQSFTRNAIGGTPPYVYTSSATAIVTIPDATLGEIQAVSDGSVTITAQDATNSKVSYPVNVSGNRIIEDFENAIEGAHTPIRLENLSIVNASGSSLVVPYVSKARPQDHPYLTNLYVETKSEATVVLLKSYSEVRVACSLRTANELRLTAFDADHKQIAYVQLFERFKIVTLRGPAGTKIKSVDLHVLGPLTVGIDHIELIP